MKKTVILLLLAGLMIFVISCDDESASSSGAAGAGSAIDNSVVGLPSCISASPSKRAVSEETKTNVKNIYEPIRYTLGAINEWTNVAREVVKFFHETVLPNGDSGDWTNNDMKNEYDVARIKWEPSSNANYTNHAEIFYKDAAGEEVKGLDVLMTVDGDAAKGIMTFDLEKMRDPENPGETAKLTVIFDGTVSPKLMEFKAVQMGGASPDVGEPTQLHAKAWYYADKTFRVSTTYYFPKVKKISVEENNTETEDHRAYTFTIVGYDEDGKDETKKNKAVLKLAYPTNISDTTNIFTTYSIGKIWGDEMYHSLKLEWINDGHSLSDLEFYTGVDVAATSIEALSNSEVEALIVGYANSASVSQADKEAIGGLVYVSKLVNPAYFTSDGFFGTYDGTTGTLDAVPSWAADNADLPIDDLDSEVLSPSSVQALTFNDTSFIVE